MPVHKQTLFKAKMEKHHWCIVGGAAAAWPGKAAFGATLNQPPPIANPLVVTGSLSGCCNSPVITVSLTDSDNDTTYATPIHLVGANPPTGFSTTFQQMPPGAYILSVEIQCGNEVIHITVYITLT